MFKQLRLRDGTMPIYHSQTQVSGQILISLAGLCLVKPPSLGNYLASSIYIYLSRKVSNNGLNELRVVNTTRHCVLKGAFLWGDQDQDQ